MPNGIFKKSKSIRDIETTGTVRKLSVITDDDGLDEISQSRNRQPEQDREAEPEEIVVIEEVSDASEMNQVGEDIIKHNQLKYETNIQNEASDREEDIKEGEELYEGYGDFGAPRGVVGNIASQYKIWLLAFCALFIVGFSLTYLYSGAYITLTPKQETLSITVEGTASKNALPGNVTYKSQLATRIQSVSIPADKEEYFEKQASGTITIVNTFSTSPQRLIKNTRFETADGLIYRINASVVIPGKKITAGKTVPGTVDALVFADSVGPEYNVQQTTFTIPGFRSNISRYNSITAKSKTPIVGGFSGKKKIVDDAKITEARKNLRIGLEKQIIDEVVASVPADMILFPKAYTISFESMADDMSQKDVIVITEKAKYNGFAFNKAELGLFLAKNSIPNYADETILITNLDTLSFSPRVTAEATSTFGFSVSGKANFKWQIDQNKFIASLAGKTRSDFSSVVNKFKSSIDKADILIRPFWKTNSVIEKDTLKVTVAN
jgi:hypothetical protein